VVEQDRLGRIAGTTLVTLGYLVGSALVILGGISFGLQLVVMPFGLAVIFAVALRGDPPAAFAFVGGSIGISAASWFSYQWGLAETIFQPHLAVLAAFVGALAFLGYFLGRLVLRIL
jgi:hypothetical protein